MSWPQRPAGFATEFDRATGASDVIDVVLKIPGRPARTLVVVAKSLAKIAEYSSAPSEDRGSRRLQHPADYFDPFQAVGVPANRFFLMMA